MKDLHPDSHLKTRLSHIDLSHRALVSTAIRDMDNLRHALRTAFPSVMIPHSSLPTDIDLSSLTNISGVDLAKGLGIRFCSMYNLCRTDSERSTLLNRLPDIDKPNKQLELFNWFHRNIQEGSRKEYRWADPQIAAFFESALTSTAERRDFFYPDGLPKMYREGVWSEKDPRDTTGNRREVHMLVMYPGACDRLFEIIFYLDDGYFGSGAAFTHVYVEPEEVYVTLPGIVGSFVDSDVLVCKMLHETMGVPEFVMIAEDEYQQRVQVVQDRAVFFVDWLVSLMKKEDGVSYVRGEYSIGTEEPSPLYLKYSLTDAFEGYTGNLRFERLGQEIFSVDIDTTVDRWRSESHRRISNRRIHPMDYNATLTALERCGELTLTSHHELAEDYKITKPESVASSFTEFYNENPTPFDGQPHNIRILQEKENDLR